MDKIIEYIKQKYNPLSIILYGSYSNGTNNLNSDFDSLVISYDHKQFHDTAFVKVFNSTSLYILLRILMETLTAMISFRFLTERLLQIMTELDRRYKRKCFPICKTVREKQEQKSKQAWIGAARCLHG